MNVPRHGLSVLQTWVATSGCWTTASVLLPHERLAVYAAPVLGLLLVVATIVAHRRLSVLERDRPTLLTFVSTFPTLFGLAAAAVATHGAVSQGIPLETIVSSLLDLHADKLLIIKGFLVAYLVEQSIPLMKLLGRKVKLWSIEAGRRWLRALEPEFRAAVKDALEERGRSTGSQQR